MDRPFDVTPVLVPDLVSADQRSAFGTLAQAVEAWLNSLADVTRINYKYRVDDWFRWLAANYGVDPLAARRTHLERYSKELQARGLMDSSVCAHMYAVRSLYRHLHLEEILDNNPMVHARMPKVDDDIVRPYLTRFELGRMIEVSRRKPRDFALVSFLAFTGVRIGAAISTNIETLSEINGHHTITARTKNRKIITIPIVPRAYRALMLYIDDRTEGPVFITRSGARLDKTYAYRLVRAVAADAGIDKKIGNHALRRTFITGSLDAGVPLRDVQHSVNHAKPETTSKYDQHRQSLDTHAGYVFAAFVGER